MNASVSVSGEEKRREMNRTKPKRKKVGHKHFRGKKTNYFYPTGFGFCLMLVKWWCFLSRKFFLFLFLFTVFFLACLFVCVFVCSVVVYLSNNPFKVKIVFLITENTTRPIINMCRLKKVCALNKSNRCMVYCDDDGHR